MTQPGRRRRPRRALWFVLGIAFGAAGAVVVRGGPAGTLEDARAWSASMLRSLERTPSPAKAAPASSADVASSGAPRPAAGNAPCPVEARPSDPCTALLAPFAHTPATTAPATPEVPTIAVDDLPRVKPAPVAHAGRAAHASLGGRRARGAVAQAAAPREDAPAAEEPDSEETPGQGINPDEDSDDSDAPPGRTASVTPEG